MEFPSLGQNCSTDGCGQLDFLPLKCECLKYFCKLHFIEHCQSNECNVAPKALERVNTDFTIYTCTADGCSLSSFLKLPCPTCDLHFCISHRFHESCPEIDPVELANKKEKWEAPRKQFAIAKANVDNLVNENFKKISQSSTKPKTAKKIQVMYLKNKAKGAQNIPASERTYFSVFKPNEYVAKMLKIDRQTPESKSVNMKAGTAVFVSKNWTLGRCIDAICELCVIKNENNSPAAPKVRLFRATDKLCIRPNRMDVKIITLTEEQVLEDGDSILMEYVSTDDLKKILDCSNVYLGE